MDRVFQSLLFFTPVVPAPLLYSFLVLAFVWFCLGAASRLSIWAQGAPRERDGVSHRGLAGVFAMSALKFFSPDCFLARRMFRRSFWRGVALSLILWGVLLSATSVAFSLAILALPFLQSQVSGRVFQLAGLAADLGGGLLLVGVVAALLRRRLLRPSLMVSVAADGRLLWLMFLILLAGFLAKGERLSSASLEGSLWYPAGWLFGVAMRPVIDGFGDSAALLYRATYTVHVLLAGALMAYLPYSKLFHMFAAQITTYAASMDHKGANNGNGRGRPERAPAHLLLH